MTQARSNETPLGASIREQIARSGPITFAAFMQRALYDAEHGYYRTTRGVVGTGGDFYTSVSATPMFGRLLVNVLREQADSFPAPLPLTIHEFGAHRGQLQRDVQAAAPDVAYHTYENQDAWPAKLHGFVIANELLDALPFHRVKVVGREWRERYVGIVDGGLGWVTGELSDPELCEPLAGLPVEYMDGYETEVSLGARRWLEALASRLERGSVLLFDYGHETEDYFAPHRAEGGLRTFSKHQRGDDPFIDIGEQDITCDVNFSDAISTAKRVGFEVREFTEQGRFFSRRVAKILRQATPGAAGEASFGGAFTPDQVRGLMTLTHPAHMGMAFKVLMLAKA